MVTPLTFTIFKQRDAPWGSQRLGTVDGTTIGAFGCLIVSISMANEAFGGGALNPGQVDDLFTNNGGYANGNLVIWSRIQALLPHVAHVGVDTCFSSPAPIAKIKTHLDNGGLVLLQVGFNGDPSQMHWLLGDGYDGENIIKDDPWYGDETDFTSKNAAGHPRYGTGDASKDILTVHYLAQGVTPVPPVQVADPPIKPVAKLPAENPLPVEVPPAPAPETVSLPIVTPETPAASDNTPGQGGISVPVDPVVNFEPNPSTKVVQREGAVAVNVSTGETIEGSRPNLLVGSSHDIGGYFSWQGNQYARTAKATTSLWPIGILATYFDAPTGQVNGVVTVTVAPPSDSVQSGVTDAELAEATVPVDQSKLTVRQLIAELVAEVLAKLIKRKPTK